MNADQFISAEAYRLMLDKIVGALANPSFDLRTQLVEVLGDAGIWPDYCRRESPALRLVVCNAGDDRTAPISSAISLANVMSA